MTKHIVLAGLLSTFALPAAATSGDLFPYYWDRYAVRTSGELVPQDLDTAPFFRNPFAVMTRDTAHAEAVARAERALRERAAQRDAAGSGGASAGANSCVCEHRS